MKDVPDDYITDLADDVNKVPDDDARDIVEEDVQKSTDNHEKEAAAVDQEKPEGQTQSQCK